MPGAVPINNVLAHRFMGANFFTTESRQFRPGGVFLIDVFKSAEAFRAEPGDSDASHWSFEMEGLIIQQPDTPPPVNPELLDTAAVNVPVFGADGLPFLSLRVSAVFSGPGDSVLFCSVFRIPQSGVPTFPDQRPVEQLGGGDLNATTTLTGKSFPLTPRNYSLLDEWYINLVASLPDPDDRITIRSVGVVIGVPAGGVIQMTPLLTQNPTFKERIGDHVPGFGNSKIRRPRRED